MSSAPADLDRWEARGERIMNLQSPIRWSSERKIGNLPLVSIAIGPDSTRNEARGHARGVIAIGDIASGWVAIGGLARGGVALGGLALGVVSLGGLAIGGLAVGGAAVGAISVGGLAVAAVAAVGGAAVGYYASGGAAFGKYVVSSTIRDPEAVKFFSQYLPWITR